ncbi:MAG: sulfite exporter TauE/SafE family protein [Ruminococcus sp.]|jgi:uncharacterized membrane protein YfcA|nr:sulfite exporter TauE/SafE family protein [Ruminococcus sp.]
MRLHIHFLLLCLLKSKKETSDLKKIIFCILGFVTGIANGLLGSGGGMIAVPMLQKAEIETKKSHATSIALILPLSIISAVLYGINGNIDYVYTLKIIPFGLLGAILGTFFLKKIKSIWLKRIFGVILIIAGVRMLWR